MTREQALNLHHIASALLEATNKLHLAGYNRHIPDLAMSYLREAETSVRVESANLTVALADLTFEGQSND